MFFIVGFLVGIAMTAPVGGVNILCLRQSLQFGFAAGLRLAMGAVLADALFASVAIFGVATLLEVITQNTVFIQLVGGLIVIFFGVSILRQTIDLEASSHDPKRRVDGLLSAFLITITNPGTIFGFIALFSTLGAFVPPPTDLIGSLILVFGVIAGCLFWWCLVAGFAARYRHKVSSNTLSRINKGTGVFLILFGVFVLLRLLIVSP